MFEQMKSEFPDFDQSTLPTIPEEWKDLSWHNDLCPSFDTGKGWIVFINYADPKDREMENSYRFSAIGLDDDGCITDVKGSCSTDDWEGLLKWL